MNKELYLVGFYQCDGEGAEGMSIVPCAIVNTWEEAQSYILDRQEWAESMCLPPSEWDYMRIPYISD